MNVLKKMTVFTLIIFLLVTGSAFSQEIFKESKNLYSTETLNAFSTTSDKNVLLIKSVPQLEGHISLSVEQDSGIDVKYEIKAKTNSRSKAIDYIDLVGLTINSTREGIEISLRAPNPARWNQDTEAVIINLIITVPEDCFVTIETRYFNVDATGPFSGFIVPSSLGRLNVSNVYGPLELITSNQRITIEDISGSISVATTNSLIDATNIESLDKAATFYNEAGDIIIDGIEGMLNVKNSYGRIEIDRFSALGGKSFVRGSSAPIMIDIIEIDESRVSVYNKYEDIEISVPENLSATLSLGVGLGKIEVNNFEFEADFIEANRFSLIAGDGESNITSNIRGDGNIYIIGVPQ